MEYYNLTVQNILPVYKNDVQKVKHQAYATNNILNSTNKDVFELSFKGVAETDLTENEIIGRDFGKDLIKLVDNKNATPEEVQKLIDKYIHYDNVKIYSLSDYRYPNGEPLKDDTRAAITCPKFDENGNLKSIALFIPKVDYNDKHSVLEFIDKTTHEVTHIAQFTKNPHNEDYARTDEKMFMNFVKKRITDRLTDKGVVDTTIALLKSNGEKVLTIDDYDKFMDREGQINPLQIGEYLHFGKDEKTQEAFINSIYDLLYDDLLNAMRYKNDPTIMNAIKKYDGYDGLKNKIKEMCAQSFIDEKEAYLAGNLARKEYNGVKAEQTNYDLINILMGMYAKALG